MMSNDCGDLTEPAAIRLLADIVAAPSVIAADAMLGSLNGRSAERLLAVARAHGMEAWLAACGSENRHIQAILSDQRARFLAARMRTAAVLDDLKELMNPGGFPWLVLKGTALEYSLYPRSDFRYSVDLDILVSSVEFGDLLSLLEFDGGFELMDRNWPLIARSMPGQLRIRSPRGILVDLHWSVMNEPGHRQVWHLPTADLLSRRRLLDPPGIPALSAIDQLIHLGLHGALSGGGRLIWLLDAHLAAVRVEDWHAVVDAAQAAGAGRPLGLVLSRAQRIWQTPVPEWALRALSGGRLGRATNGVIDRGAVRSDPARPTFARAWARSSRATTGQSVAEFGKHGAAWLRSGCPGVRRESPLTDRGDRRSPLFAVEDAEARSSYLAAVRAAD